MVYKLKKIAKFHRVHENPLVKKILYNYFISKVSKKNVLSREESNKIKNYYLDYGIKIKNYRWHSYYTATNNNFDKKYIPESLFYAYVVPTLNNKRMSLAYEDKSNLESYNTIIKIPKILIKNISGYYYDESNKRIDYEDIKLKEGDYIIKPSLDSGGGRNVELLEIKGDLCKLNNKEVSFQNVLKKYERDFIIQEKLSQQGTNFYKIYPHSLNTLRITTLRFGKDIIILSAVARFGNNGSIVDNQQAGGYAVGIDLKKGRLKTEGVAKGYKSKKHEYTDVYFEGVEVEKLGEIKVKILKLHEEFKYFDLISWDIAIDKNKDIFLIEVNTGEQEINFHQSTNGPLFGEYTDYILNKVHKKFNKITL